MIKEDIQLAIDVSNRLGDVYCLFRCFLSIFELKQRYNNFYPSDYFTTFHQLDKITLANSFVYDNVELLVPKKTALEYSIMLYKQGYEELAHDIFLRASPFYILNQSKTISPNRYMRDTYREIDEIAIVSTWAKVASLFRPIKEIFDKIEELTIEKSHENNQRDLHSEVTTEVLDISIETKNWSNLKDLEVVLLKKNRNSKLFYFYFDIVYQLSNENDFYNHCLQALNSWEISQSNPINRRLLLISLFVNPDINKSIKIFEKLLPPNKIENPSYSLNENDLLNYIFDYSRFLYITTKDFSISPVIFLPTEKKHTKRAFYNAIAELGKSYAYLYHNYKDAAIGYYLNFEHLLQLFHYSHTDYGYEYSISENKSFFIELVLKISSRLSDDIFKEILDRLDSEWNTNKRYWNTKQIQEVIEWVCDSNLNKEWCIAQLNKIDAYLFNSGYVEDRIEKGIFQIRLWSKVQEIGKGENILNHLMNISLDVRGEKDYQLDYIVDWIKNCKTNKSDEIKYYLQRVNSLRERVNSASHTPSGELLSLSFDCGNGFEVFKYLLFEGLVNFNDSLESIFSHLLSAAPKSKSLLIKLFTRIVLAYDNYHQTRPDFLYELFTKTPDLTITELKQIVNEISICSISEYKNDYLVKVQEYALNRNISLDLIGINKPLEKSEHYSNGKKSEYDLGNGTKITSAELLDRVNTIQELKTIQTNAGYNGNFDWKPIYQKILKKATDDEIIEFISTGKKDPHELADIANSLIYEKRIEIAKAILYQTIHKGEKYGWVTFIDGGSKIIPFELLSKIEERSTFQSIVLNDFCNSIITFDIQALETLLKDAPKIWSYFSSDLNYEVLYDEIKIFRNELLKTQSIDETIPSINGTLNGGGLLEEILFFLITFPSDFNYALYNILFEEYEIDEDIIRQLLKKLFENKFYLKYVKLLAVINVRHKKIVTENKENIISLLNNKRYDIFNISFELLKSIDVNPDEYFTPQTKELPFIYNIEFQYKPPVFNTVESEFRHISKEGFLKETEDPLVYVRLYLTEIKMLAKEAEVSVLNIAHRIVALGKDLGFPTWCNSISEEEIRKIYNGRFDLEISYKRPRNQLVWDGLMKVVKELWELDLIDVTLANLVSKEFDEYAYLIETKPQPNFIGSILNEKSGDAPSARKGWAKEITDEYLINVMPFKLSENSFCLAQYSVIRGMGWGHSEEIRQSFVDLVAEVHGESDREMIFNLTSQYNISEYQELYDRGIVLYNGLLTINKKRNWLAINPLLCKELGYNLNLKEGNFRWDDTSGNKIFESIYWQINSTDNYSKNHKSETGHGWAVILYEAGYDKLKRIIGNKEIFHHRKGARFMEYISNRHNEELKEQFSIYNSEKFQL